MRLLSSPDYQEGELIRAAINFPVARVRSDQRWQFAGFLIEPPRECGTLERPCFWQSTGIFDKSDPVVRLGDMPGPVDITLNNHLPALRPGHYRLTAVARKLVLTSRSPLSTTYGYADPPRFTVSNAVEFDIRPASAAWVERTIAASVAVLKGPQPGNRESYETRRRAAEQLRFLDTPASWRAALVVMPEEENVLLRGLSATREPARVCELMRSAVSAPEQAVSTYFLNTLVQVCRTSKPVTIDSMAAELAASLANKLGESRGVALQTLLEQLQQPSQRLPDWIPIVKREFPRAYATLPVARQSFLLSLYGNALASPEIVPFLEAVLDAWKPGDYYEAPRQALATLFLVDPARARDRIAAELRKPKTWLDVPQLEMLAPDSAHFTDIELIESLAAAQRPGGWNSQLSMAAIALYASPRARSRIRAIYESQDQSCQPELMAYFVRADPEYADRVFHSHPWDMTSEPPPCTVQYFQRTPRLAMGPVLERYIAAYLMHRTVYLKIAAAEALGKFGSPAALPPLWEAFRYLHDYWKDNPAGLEQNGEGVRLEVALRDALARGHNWLAAEPMLSTIQSLCITERCKAETIQDLNVQKAPLRIEISPQPPGFYIRVAQYYGIESLEWLEVKLSQFSRGTRFTIGVHGTSPEMPVQRLQEFAARHGLILVRE